MSIEGKSRPQMPLVEALAANDTATQVAGLCWRMSGRKLEVLLVTSRDTGRWIIPKGWPIKSLSHAQSALREAYEEAGVDGAAAKTRIGYYPYVKIMGEDCGIPCSVDVYPIKVKRLLDTFPEKGQRRRKWFPLEKAALKVDEPELADMLRNFTPLRPAAEPPQEAS
jgi:8-oxo-dGTP pyrophosphatase MutT (NUDIX family)